MSTTQLILVGGFLGAGKTTLLARAASVLLGQGKRVGLITNDQAADLIKDLYASSIRMSPLSVLLDPRRRWDALTPQRQSAIHRS